MVIITEVTLGSNTVCGRIEIEDTVLNLCQSPEDVANYIEKEVSRWAMRQIKIKWEGEESKNEHAKRFQKVGEYLLKGMKQ